LQGNAGFFSRGREELLDLQENSPASFSAIFVPSLRVQIEETI
jgi:hypothetical protein